MQLLHQNIAKGVCTQTAIVLSLHHRKKAIIDLDGAEGVNSLALVTSTPALKKSNDPPISAQKSTGYSKHDSLAHADNMAVLTDYPKKKTFVMD